MDRKRASRPVSLQEMSCEGTGVEAREPRRLPWKLLERAWESRQEAKVTCTRPKMAKVPRGGHTSDGLLSIWWETRVGKRERKTRRTECLKGWSPH